jgi:hypothetical protein
MRNESLAESWSSAPRVPSTLEAEAGRLFKTRSGSRPGQQSETGLLKKGREESLKYLRSEVHYTVPRETQTAGMS